MIYVLLPLPNDIIFLNEELRERFKNYTFRSLTTTYKYPFSKEIMTNFVIRSIEWHLFLTR